MKLNTLLALLFAVVTPWISKSEAATVIYTQASLVDANIVQNGDFAYNGGIPGWNYGGYSWSGDYGINGGPCVGINTYFSQVLPTQPGQTYLLQFSIAGATPSMIQSGPYGIGVIWDSQGEIDYPLTESYDWITEQLQVTAYSTQTLLEFDRIDPALPFLSAVSVVPVPEPSSVSLFFMILSLLGVWRVSPAFVRKPIKKQ